MKVVDVNPFFYPFVGGIEHRRWSPEDTMSP